MLHRIRVIKRINNTRCVIFCINKKITRNKRKQTLIEHLFLLGSVRCFHNLKYHLTFITTMWSRHYKFSFYGWGNRLREGKYLAQGLTVN